MCLLRPSSDRIGLFQAVDQPVPHVVQIQWHWDRPEAADWHLYVELPPVLDVSLERAEYNCCERVVCRYARLLQRRASTLYITYSFRLPSGGPPQSRHCCDADLPHLCSKA